MNITDYFNYTNDTLVVNEVRPYTVIEVVLITAITAVLSVVTVVGNVLVILSFKMDKRLQTVNNYFLLSLASADFMIGLFSMPLFTAYTVLQEWRLGPVVCDLWLALDYLCSNASVLNLLMISFDRYYSVTNPLRYRARRNSRRAAIMIACAWVISFITWPPLILAWPYIEGKRSVPSNDCYIQFLKTNYYVTVGTTFLAFYIPVTVMIVLYYKIWRETENRKHYLADLFAENNRTDGREASVQETTATTNCASSPDRTKVSCARRLKEFLIKLCNVDCDPDAEDEGMSPGAQTPCSAETPLQSSRATSVTLRPEQLQALQALIDRQNDDDEAKENSVGQGEGRQQRPDGGESIYTIMIRLPAPSAPDDAEPQPSVTMISGDTTCSPGSQQQAPPPPMKTSLSTSALLVNSVTDNNLHRFNSSDLLGVGKLNSDGKFVPAKHAVKPRININVNSSNNHKKRNQKIQEKKHDKKAARTLTAILAAFIITWTPYCVLVLVKSFYGDDDDDVIPKVLWDFSYYLCYLNSMINPLCYALANANFRKTYRRILTCTWRKRSKMSIIIRGLRGRQA